MQFGWILLRARNSIYIYGAWCLCICDQMWYFSTVMAMWTEQDTAPIFFNDHHIFFSAAKLCGFFSVSSQPSSHLIGYEIIFSQQKRLVNWRMNDRRKKAVRIV